MALQISLKNWYSTCHYSLLCTQRLGGTAGSTPPGQTAPPCSVTFYFFCQQYLFLHVKQRGGWFASSLMLPKWLCWFFPGLSLMILDGTAEFKLCCVIALFVWAIFEPGRNWGGGGAKKNYLFYLFGQIYLFVCVGFGGVCAPHGQACFLSGCILHHHETGFKLFLYLSTFTRCWSLWSDVKSVFSSRFFAPQQLIRKKYLLVSILSCSGKTRGIVAIGSSEVQMQICAFKDTGISVSFSFKMQRRRGHKCSQVLSVPGPVAFCFVSSILLYLGFYVYLEYLSYLLSWEYFWVSVEFLSWLHTRFSKRRECHLWCFARFYLIVLY